MVIRGDSNIGVLWYLTAMLPMLPILAIFVQKTCLKCYGILSFVYVCLWYFFLGRYDDCFIPLSYLRALGGLALGVLIYCLKGFEENRLDDRKEFFTVIMAMCLICPIILTLFNIKITSMCSKISLPLYLVHLNVADILDHVCRHYIILNDSLQYVLYFSITFICTIVLMCAGNMFDKFLRKVGI